MHLQNNVYEVYIKSIKSPGPDVNAFSINLTLVFWNKPILIIESGDVY